MGMCHLSHPSREFLDASIHLQVYMSTEDGILKLPMLLIVGLHGGLDHQK